MPLLLFGLGESLQPFEVYFSCVPFYSNLPKSDFIFLLKDLETLFLCLSSLIVVLQDVSQNQLVCVYSFMFTAAPFNIFIQVFYSQNVFCFNFKYLFSSLFGFTSSGTLW